MNQKSFSKNSKLEMSLDQTWPDKTWHDTVSQNTNKMLRLNTHDTVNLMMAPSKFKRRNPRRRCAENENVEDEDQIFKKNISVPILKTMKLLENLTGW